MEIGYLLYLMLLIDPRSCCHYWNQIISGIRKKPGRPITKSKICSTRVQTPKMEGTTLIINFSDRIRKRTFWAIESNGIVFEVGATLRVK